MIGDLLCPQSSHLSCGCQTQQIEEAGTKISHISRSLNEEWEGKPREKENYLSEWGLDSVYWKAEVPAFLKKSGKRRKTRENNVAKKKRVQHRVS